MTASNALTWPANASKLDPVGSRSYESHENVTSTRLLRHADHLRHGCPGGRRFPVLALHPDRSTRRDRTPTPSSPHDLTGTSRPGPSTSQRHLAAAPAGSRNRTDPAPAARQPRTTRQPRRSPRPAAHRPHPRPRHARAHQPKTHQRTLTTSQPTTASKTPSMTHKPQKHWPPDHDHHPDSR